MSERRETSAALRLLVVFLAVLCMGPSRADVVWNVADEGPQAPDVRLILGDDARTLAFCAEGDYELTAAPEFGTSATPLSFVPGQWTWVSGSSYVAEQVSYGIYGTKGIPDRDNLPGSRSGAASCTDAAGNFWIFGGEGFTTSGGSGFLNDLWKWSASSGQWTWLAGSKEAKQVGIYGTQGVAAAENDPGSRVGAVLWADNSGNLWLFGGGGFTSDGRFGFFNNVWKWNVSSRLWTWVSGPNSFGYFGVYGTQGVAAAENTPGGRVYSSSWSDTGGNLWLFGGQGSAASGGGFLNDLWKWSNSSGQWTWVSGSDSPDQAGVYGIQGVAAAGNVPGARTGSVSWTDTGGNLWLFGGLSNLGLPARYVNDLWKWNISSGQWTWVSGSNGVNQAGRYGIQGVAASENVPGARIGAATRTDTGGDLWLFGGLGYAANAESTYYLNDLWKWSNSSGQWTWVSGSNYENEDGNYGIQGAAAPGNVPRARGGALSWSDASGNLCLLGGYNFLLGAYPHTPYLNDLWKWNPSSAEWTWVGGSNGWGQPGIYGTQGAAAPGNVPGAREGAVSWTDESGDFWLFGGVGYPESRQGYLNDLWKRSPSSGEWTWISGSNSVNQAGRYGTREVAAPENAPGARTGSASWADAGGNLWLFGGDGRDSQGYPGGLSDLWMWSISSGQWAWVSGSNVAEQNGVYGVRGVADPHNVPGSRINPVSWTDAAGNLWLFGGAKSTEWGPDGGYFRSLNDLWRWNVSSAEWTWVNGFDSDFGNKVGTYGTQGVAALENVPGARCCSVSWTDASGNLWLFGGYGYATSGWGSFNDLWKWNIASGQWTWVSGSSALNQPGTYGTLGIAAPGNVPGARSGAVSWADPAGNFWLLGGQGSAASGVGLLSDLWMWSNSNGQWTWVGGPGPDPGDGGGAYGTQGLAAPGNVPGARFRAVSWGYAAGNFWLFGGTGLASTPLVGALNDLWVYSYCVIPSAPAGVPGTRLGPGPVVLSASGAGTGQGYKWYSAARGGSPLQTGSISFTTPAIRATTTYYVSVYDTATGCESARTPVTATVVNPLEPRDTPVRRIRG